MVTKIFFLLIFFVSISYAIPQQIGYINDYADYIPDNYESEINVYLTELEKNTSSRIIFIITHDNEGLGTSLYINKTFIKWGLRQRDILVLIDKEDTIIEAKIGDELTSIFSDQEVFEILHEALDDFDENAPALGVYNIATKMGSIIEENKNQGNDSFITFLIVPLIFIIFIAGYIFFKKPFRN